MQFEVRKNGDVVYTTTIVCKAPISTPIQLVRQVLENNRSKCLDNDAELNIVLHEIMRALGA